MKRWFFLLALAGCQSNVQQKSSWDLDGGDALTVGKLFAQQRSCPTCHDPAGDGSMSGSTAAAAGTMAYPANLTQLDGWADIQIIRAIKYGVDDEEEPLCPPMPHFATPDQGEPMTDLEANLIVGWLRSLPPVEKEVPESSCPPLK